MDVRDILEPMRDLLVCILLNVFQLVRRAEGRWRRIDASHLVAKVFEGVQFVDGVEVIESVKRRRGAA